MNAQIKIFQDKRFILKQLGFIGLFFALFFYASCNKKEETTTYTITFNSNGGTSITSQSVNANGTATQPTAPTKTGFTFSGWYSDAALSQTFNFSTPITANTTLYAKWTENYSTGSATINGKTYKIVTIGTQTWMAENLNEDGNTAGVSSCYNNNANNCTTYGRLYNWDAAKDIDTKITGWHLPSDAEWTTLSAYLGGESGAGDKMKVGGGSGFEALLGGNQDSNGSSYGMGGFVNFWSSSPTGSGNAWSRDIYSYNAYLYRSNYGTYFRFSVRLLKD